MHRSLFRRIFCNGWVSGLALITTVVAVGALHLAADVVDDLAGPYRKGISFRLGWEMAYQQPNTDSMLQRIDAALSGTLGNYLAGRQAGTATRERKEAEPAAPVDAVDSGLGLDEAHILPDGRTWRNVGITHVRQVYDPQTSPHFVAAATAADAVLTEDGLYFDAMRSTATTLGKPAGSLGETRSRAAAAAWPYSIYATTFVDLVIVGVSLLLLIAWPLWLRAGRVIARGARAVGSTMALLPGSSHIIRMLTLGFRVCRTAVRWACWPFVMVASGVVRIWPWRGRTASKSKPTPIPLTEPENKAAIVWLLVVFAVFRVMPEVIAACKPCLRHDPVPAVAMAHPPAGIRERIDRLVQSHLMTFDEASEYDSRSMYRGVVAYMQAHPECRNLLVVTGAAHANDMERHAADDARSAN